MTKLLSAVADPGRTVQTANKTRLNTLRNEPVRIAGNGGNLAMFLLPLNDPAIAARIGTERVIRARTDDVIRTEGELFRSHSGGTVRGGRYLLLEGDTIVAALNVTTIARQGTVASNLYVAPAHRRHGLATRLIKLAQRDFPKLAADTALTVDGAAFLGYPQAPNQSAAADGPPSAVAPHMVFHGTNQALRSFDVGESGRNFSCSAGALFFTDELAVADQIADYVAENEGGTPHVIEAAVTINRPLVRDFAGEAVDVLALVAEAKALGHDGVIALNARDRMPAWPANQYIAFDAGQVAIVAARPSQGSALHPADAGRAADTLSAQDWLSTHGKKAAPRA